MKPVVHRARAYAGDTKWGWIRCIIKTMEQRFENKNLFNAMKPHKPYVPTVIAFSQQIFIGAWNSPRQL